MMVNQILNTIVFIKKLEENGYTKTVKEDGTITFVHKNGFVYDLSNQSHMDALNAHLQAETIPPPF